MTQNPNGEPRLGRDPELVQVSNSEIQLYKSCRRAWWLSSYRGLVPREEKLTGPLPLGSRVHNALEQYYRDGRDMFEAYAELLRIDEIEFSQTIQANDDEAVKKFNNEAELGRVMLEGYEEWLKETNADHGLVVEGVEKIVSFRPAEFEGKVELRGKLDLIIRDKFNGFIASFDHKTAASFDSYYKYSLMSEQLMFYTSIMVASHEREVIDGGIYNLLKKSKRTARAKGPFYERMHIRFNKKTLQAFWLRTLGTVRDMMTTRKQLDEGVPHQLAAYPRPSNDCSWKCPFYHGCTMFDDGSRAEEWLANNFVVGNPDARYDLPITPVEKTE